MGLRVCASTKLRYVEKTHFGNAKARAEHIRQSQNLHPPFSIPSCHTINRADLKGEGVESQENDGVETGVRQYVLLRNRQERAVGKIAEITARGRPLRRAGGKLAQSTAPGATDPPRPPQTTASQKRTAQDRTEAL